MRSTSDVISTGFPTIAAGRRAVALPRANAAIRSIRTVTIARERLAAVRARLRT
jgi:hypothetical protein